MVVVIGMLVNYKCCGRYTYVCNFSLLFTAYKIYISTNNGTNNNSVHNQVPFNSHS
jgi:hypothetical protein